MKTQFQNIVEKFGSVKALASAMHKPLTTVYSWGASGRIPAKHQEEVLAVGKKHGVTPDDFFKKPAA